jgi:FAD:protein FMN transferase
MMRAAAALVLSIGLLASAPAATVSATYHGLRYLMGTWCDLTLLDEPSPDAPAIAEAAFQEIARLEDVMTTWRGDSELSRVNAEAGSGTTEISDDLAAVVGAALDACRESGGAFDPTVGSLLALWRFDTDRPAIPAAGAIAAARAHVGCDKVSVWREPAAIRLEAGVSLDLGGIGKGFALDRALDVLRRRGVHRAKFDFGSSSLAFEGRLVGGWPVVVADPRDRDRPMASFRVAEGSVSSSGQYERSFVRSGRRYGHIFDPREGRPVQSNLLLVTVIAPTATEADALSTAFFVLGRERSAAWLARLPAVAALFVEAGAGGRVTLNTVGDVPQFLALSS